MAIDIYYAIREFYLLEGLHAESINLLTPFRHSHEKWKEDFLAYKEEYVSKLANAIYDYTVLVSASEMRWARDEADFYYRNWYNSKCHEREDVYEGAIDYNGDFLLKAAEEIFSSVEWTKWYGGEKWANIAKAGQMYHKISPTLFIDHCVDLMHNGSIYFDKDAGIFSFSDQEEYKTMLDEKRDNLFEDFLFFDYNSSVIKDFTKRINKISGSKFPIFSIKRKNPADITISSVINYHPINWGNKTFKKTLGKNLYFTGI